MTKTPKPAKADAPSDETAKSSSSPKARSVEIPQSIGVRQLADLLQVSAVDVIKQLMRNDIMANINQVIDHEAATAVAVALGHKASLPPQADRGPAGVITETSGEQPQAEEPGALQLRPPIVTVMGHVNHGKTRLLDAIRQANVMATEAGGITQHIGAYQVNVNEQKITFLDTPGHEAFTAMRAHGAQITDIAILVVAADDGIMPQTLEAIDHARAAGVPIVVAINKIDKPNANPELVKQQLADNGLLIEEWGGDIVCVSISAKEKIGISELLENLLVVAEVEELKADPSQPPVGVVIEAKLDKSRGPLATVLIQTGTLRLGDTIVVGATWGRVRAMFNDMAKRIKKAEPATPVEILGLSRVPEVGGTLTAVANERQAQSLVEKRKLEIQQETPLAPKSVRLTNLYDQISAGQIKGLNVILRTDVQGSIEPIRSSLERVGTEEVQVRIIRNATGNITESDVMLAIASKGLIIGFGVSSEPGARQLAEAESIDIRHYDVIYNLVDDLEKALKGMLEPTYVDIIEGRADVKATFSTGKGGKVAGVYVAEGKVSRGIMVKVRRGEEVVCESVVNSLRRFKDDIKEVSAGLECGVGVEGFNEFEIGDILEFFRREKVS
jgi:translation initiation factor IF-2